MRLQPFPKYTPEIPVKRKPPALFSRLASGGAMLQNHRQLNVGKASSLLTFAEKTDRLEACPT
jgi:hypothetical protein